MNRDPKPMHRDPKPRKLTPIPTCPQCGGELEAAGAWMACPNCNLPVIKIKTNKRKPNE